MAQGATVAERDVARLKRAKEKDLRAVPVRAPDYMVKKGSVLIISCWVLVILVIFALSLGHRSAVNLRISNFGENRLKAYCLAKAGISRAILELNDDARLNAYDALSDSWADEKIFRKIILDENNNNFVSIRYKDNEGRTKFGAQDERAKININKASKNLLTQLFSDKKIEAAGELASLIEKWRTQQPGGGPPLTGEEKMIKYDSLKTPEELLLILEYFYKDKTEAEDVYDKVEKLLTVYGADDKINVNTAPEEILTMLVVSLIDVGQEASINVDTLVSTLITQRQSQPFTAKLLDDFNVDSSIAPDDFLAELKGKLIVQSDYFRIEAKASVDSVVKQISAVYERPDTQNEQGKMVYWHEN